MSQISKIQVSGSLYDIRDEYARIQIQELKKTNNSESNDLVDYTAFEVFAHNYDIPVGECEELGGYVNYEIQTNTKQMFTIRTMQPDYTKSDIIVDWGDGSISYINLGQFNQNDDNADNSHDLSIGERNYTVEHDYANSLNSENVNSKKYIVKIYGRQYYNIMTKVTPKVKPAGVTYIYSNIICRILDIDLPIASHIGNLTGMFEKSECLLNVNAELLKYRYFENCSQMFRYCNNLLNAIGFKRCFTKSNCSQMFAACYSLQNADAQLALDSIRSSSSSGMYVDCINLAVDVSSLIPEVNGSHGPYNVSNAFDNCRLLTGTIPANKLWNSKFVSQKQTQHTA